METKLQIGDLAPEFEALTDGGETVRLSDYFVIDEAGRIADVRVKVRPTDSVALALQALGGD